MKKEVVVRKNNTIICKKKAGNKKSGIIKEIIWKRCAYLLAGSKINLNTQNKW